MAKGRLTGSFSQLLYTLGDAIHFAPASAYAPPKTEKDKKQKWEGRRERFLARCLKVKTALAKMCEQSFFLGVYKAFIRSFFTTRIRSFGVLFFSCGFLQILSYFLSGYLPFAVGDENNLIFGVTLIFLTLLCSFTRGDVKDVVKKSFLYRSALIPLFGAEKWEFPTGRGGDNFFGMLLVGSILAFFSVIFSPFAVVLVLLLISLILFVFYQPEAGLVVTALSFSVTSFGASAFLTMLTLASFLCKCAVGKKSLFLSPRDLLVVLCLLPLLFSEKGSLFFFVLSALYLMTPGLLRTLASVRRLLLALTLGGAFGAVMIVVRFVLTMFFEEVLFRFPNLDQILFLSGEEWNLAPLVMIAPVALGFFRGEKRSTEVIFSPIVLILFAAAIFSGESLVLWIALLVAITVQNLMTYRFAMIGCVIFGLVLMIGLNFIPPALFLKTVSVLNFAPSAEAATGNIFTLLGVGSIWGFVVPALLVCYFIYSVVLFVLRTTRPKAFPRVLGGIGGVVAFVVMAFGGVGMDERCMILLPLLLALPRVSLSCSKREEIRLPY